MQTAWLVMAAETVISTGRGAVQSSLCYAEGLRALLPCVPGSEWHGCTYVCSRGQCSRACKARGRSVWDGGTLLVLLPATQRPLLEGRRHRGTGQPASLRRSRIQRGTAATHRGSSKCCPGKTLCPYEELQPGRAAHAMPSTALRCAVSEDRGGTRARQGPVCGHARTCCCTRCRTPCATPRPYHTSSTFTT